MLEDRLSNTYNQHTIGGYSLPPQRNSGIYPSIANGPIGAGGVESFYTGNAPAESYVQPQSAYYTQPQQQYSGRDNKRASIVNPGYPAPEQMNDIYSQYPPQQQQPQAQPVNQGYPTPDPNYHQYPQQTQPPPPQRSGSWQATEPAPPQYASQSPSYPTESAPQQAPPPMNAPSQPPNNYAPSEPAITPSVDPNAAFYYGTQQAPPPQADQGHNTHQTVQSPPQFKSPAPAQVSPQQFAHQPVKQQAPSQQQQQYWPQQAQLAQPTYAAPPPGPTYSGYTQESFPSAPHHAPQQKVAEESLIEF